VRERSSSGQGGGLGGGLRGSGLGGSGLGGSELGGSGLGGGPGGGPGGGELGGDGLTGGRPSAIGYSAAMRPPARGAGPGGPSSSTSGRTLSPVGNERAMPTATTCASSNCSATRLSRWSFW
jgi:hypothetical protein